MILFNKDINWSHENKLEKYKDLYEEFLKRDWIMNTFPIEMRC